jgi:hypothetical protein
MPHKDPEKRRSYARRHYAANKAVYIARSVAFNRKVQAKNKKRVLEWLSEHPCVDCGEGDPIVLEFDHVLGKKTDNIADMVNSCYSWPRILEEIAKCVVRCANCHRRVTYHRRRLLTPS